MNKDKDRFKPIVKDVVDFLSTRANPDLVAKYSRYFKEGYPGWGISDADLKTCHELLNSKYPDLTLKDIIPLGLELFQVGKYEAGSIAIRLLMKHRKAYDLNTFKGVRSWYDQGVSNWAHSDTICTNIIPEFFMRGIITYKNFEDWKGSESKWTRRAVPVALLHVRKTEPPPKLLDFLDSMLLDGVREVHQGLGWFLRELWKLHPEPVETFLLKYKNTAARLIFQYATEKMTKEQKERFRKEKTART